MWSGYSEQGTGSEERGPASFSIQQPGVVQAGAAGPQATQVRGGIQGSAAGVTAAAPGLGQVQDRTMTALFKMGEDIIAPQLNRIKDEQFLQGVQQAASGKALVDIDRDQPWYTKIFGDTPLIEGARSYEVSTKAAQWASTIEQAMPELRKQSPDTIPKFVMGSVEKLLTGDASADLMLRGEVLKRLPGLVERHTKEHYKYNQEQISRRATEYVLSAGAEYQATMSNPDPATSSPEARNAASELAFSAFMPAPGEDPTAYEKRVARGVELLAERGDFHVIGMLRERGMFTHMAPEDRMRVERTVNAFGDYHRSHSQSATPFLTEAAMLYERAQNSLSIGEPYNAEQYLRDVQDLNKRYRERTGNPIDLVTPTQQAAGAATAAQAAYSMRRAQLHEAQKSGKAQATLNMFAQAAQSGDVGTLLAMDAGTKPVAEEAFNQVYHSIKAPADAPDPQAWVADRHTRMLIDNANKGYVDERIKHTYTAPLRSLPDVPDKNFFASYMRWQELDKHPDSHAARMGYLGEEMDARLSAFHTLQQGSPEAYEQNYKIAMLAPKQRKALVKEEVAALNSAISSDAGFLAEHRFGSNLTPQGKAYALHQMQAVAELYKSAAPELGMQEIARRSMSAVLASGSEFYGGYGWKRPHAMSKPLDQIVPMPRSEIDAVFGEVVQSKLGGKSPASMTILRQPDAGGKAQFTGFYTTSDGVPSAFSFTSDDIETTYREPAAKRLTARMRELDRTRSFRESDSGKDLTKPAFGLYPSMK